MRVAELRQQFGLVEPITHLDGGADYTTFQQSEDGNRTWIDYFLVSRRLLDEGLVRQAGILQEPHYASRGNNRLMGSTDHALSMIQLDLGALMASAKPAAGRPRLPRLNLKSAKDVHAFQKQVAKAAAKLGLGSKLAEAEAAVQQWEQGRDLDADWHGRSDWGSVDTVVQEAIDELTRTLVAVIVDSWRRITSTQPAFRKRGRRVKDCWSIAYVKKARRFRRVTDIVSRWRQKYCGGGRRTSKTAILRLFAPLEAEWFRGRVPTLGDPHRVWAKWIDRLEASIPELKRQLHASERRMDQYNMKCSVKRRSAQFKGEATGRAVRSFLKTEPRDPPISATTVTTAGARERVTDPVLLRHTLDKRFESWMSEELFREHPLDKYWYEQGAGSWLAAAGPANDAVRLPAAGRGSGRR